MTQDTTHAPPPPPSLSLSLFSPISIAGPQILAPFGVVALVHYTSQLFTGRGESVGRSQSTLLPSLCAQEATAHTDGRIPPGHHH